MTRLHGKTAYHRFPPSNIARPIPIMTRHPAPARPSVRTARVLRGPPAWPRVRRRRGIPRHPDASWRRLSALCVRRTNRIQPPASAVPRANTPTSIVTAPRRDQAQPARDAAISSANGRRVRGAALPVPTSDGRYRNSASRCLPSVAHEASTLGRHPHLPRSAPVAVRCHVGRSSAIITGRRRSVPSGPANAP